MEKQSRIAVLIDAENISKKYIKLIMDEINEFGIPTYKRVYGDFTNPSVLTWKEELENYALTPVFQFNYTRGKNASDSAMTIDAMDILYSGNVDGFCLVTSDSDFTKLAVRLREAGKLVVGMGEQKTPTALVMACETFKFLDLLYREENSEKEKRVTEQDAKSAGDVKKDKRVRSKKIEEPEKQTKENSSMLIPTKKQLEKEIIAIIDAKSDEDGWINLSEIGVSLSKRVPGFDPRNYKYSKLRKLIESYDKLEINAVQNPKNELLKIVYVKVK